VATWTYIPYFHKMYIEQYISWYKAAMCFAVAITKLLNLMHVEDDDVSKMRKIPGTEKSVNIYTNPKPWAKRFKLTGTDRHLDMYVEEDVSVENATLFADAKIRFLMAEPVLILNPAKGIYEPQYMESIIRIEIIENNGGKSFKEFRLKDVNINNVLKTVDAAGLL